MDADADRKPVMLLCAPAEIGTPEFPCSQKVDKIASSTEDPLFAALRRMRIEDEVDNRMRNEELDEELERLISDS